MLPYVSATIAVNVDHPPGVILGSQAMNFMRFALWRVTALLALTALLLPSPASAQRFKWWQAEHVQRELGLTKEQSARLEEIFQSSLTTLRKQKESLDAAEAEFNRLVAKGDFQATLTQVDAVESARAALNKSRAVQLVHMRRVLTADQHAKLTAILNGRDRDGRGNDRNR
jgi:Spy/CpxP family protein refolding chaperone